MTKVLVQRSHDARFTEILSALRESFETIVSSDPELGEAIDKHRREIAGFVLFHSTERTTRASRLLLDERFNVPTTPMAYLGPFGRETRLPYGVVPFAGSSSSELVAFLSSPRRVRVLVVEDDDGIRDVLRLSLSRHFDVQTATDGAQALERLADATYEAVVLDVMLPRVGGDELFRHLRETAPDTAVLVITAYDTEERALDFAFRGADGYLAKPFDSNRAFRQKLVEALCRRHEHVLEDSRTRQTNETDDAWRAYRKRLGVYA